MEGSSLAGVRCQNELSCRNPDPRSELTLVTFAGGTGLEQDCGYRRTYFGEERLVQTDVLAEDV